MMKTIKKGLFVVAFLSAASLAQALPAELNWQPVRRAISILETKYPIIPLFCPQLMNCIHDPKVKFCCQEIKNTQSWVPLARLWNSIESDLAHESSDELCEFIRFVIVILYSHMREVKAESTLENMLILYEKIVALPIPELLNILETLIQEGDYISTEYELINGELTWAAWLKKYWWAPPIAFFAIALAFYRRWAYLGAQG